MNIFWAYLYFTQYLSWFIFFGSLIALICAAYFALRYRLYWQALFLAGTIGLPAASYVFSYVNGTILFPIVRELQVASWHRASITRNNKPRVFISTLEVGGGTLRNPEVGGVLPKALVVLGQFERAYGLIHSDWYYFERTPGMDCAEIRSAKNMLDLLRKETPCVTATKTDKRWQFGKINMPEIAEPHLALLNGEQAPSHLENFMGGTFSNGALELRLVSGQNNQLVSFWEATWFWAPVLRLTLDGWFKVMYAAGHPVHPDNLKFVLEALGDA
jgi:hypothetical protein